MGGRKIATELVKAIEYARRNPYNGEGASAVADTPPLQPGTEPATGTENPGTEWNFSREEAGPGEPADTVVTQGAPGGEAADGPEIEGPANETTGEETESAEKEPATETVPDDSPAPGGEPADAAGTPQPEETPQGGTETGQTESTEPESGQERERGRNRRRNR